ncbi:enoyl-CoA hydratase-related protein [Stagnihabitans tardus]|uniref:Enoyl-CoA hydratase n=1 Tax=Stagnihabitans tardus TaxID=2699202 RepID=A0AAE4Y8T0_9RHOB|nr:enoyl-CoA hydratase-related protein [Stagnihabitans tardus]NBZ87354.1 enoyl-CoA hydratase [Stagnihabitans tardus]
MDTLLLERHDAVLLIRLNRPEALNALSRKLMGELSQVLAEAEADTAVRAIVITGSEKAFAAGADVREMAAMTYAEVAALDLYGPEAEAIGRIRKPLIAAVSGYCLGGGCELAMMCDFILASETARFGQPEINLGINAGMGGTQRLTRLVGKAKAMEMNLTGRMMDATEAERAGLVARIVPGDVVAEALKVATGIAQKSALAVRAVKESVSRALELPLSEGLRFERRMFHSAFATEDQSEGMAAFLEKRPAQFKDC